MSSTGKLRADVEKIGASVEGVGAHRAVAVRLLDGEKIWAYPIVGIPTAEILNDVADKARRAEQQEIPVLVYEHIGIRDAWNAHLRWHGDHLRAVRSINVSEADRNSVLSGKGSSVLVDFGWRPNIKKKT